MCAIERDRELRDQETRSRISISSGLARTPEMHLRIEQYIASPPEQIFAAWVDPRQMGDWFAPTDDFGPTIGEVDPQVGGNYPVVMFPPAPRSRMSRGAILQDRCAANPELYLVRRAAQAPAGTKPR